MAAYGDAPANPNATTPTPGIPLPGLVKEFIAQTSQSPNIKIANSIDEIAAWIGAKPEILKETIEEYNAACAEKYDSIFSKDSRLLLPLMNGTLLCD